MKRGLLGVALLFLFLCAVPTVAQLSSKIAQQDPEAEKAMVVLTEVLHWPQSEALELIEQAKTYADDSPFSYPAVLKLVEQLATRGSAVSSRIWRHHQVMSTIKACGGAVALIDGTDNDLSEMVLYFFELQTNDSFAREQGYTVLSSLDARGIPVFKLLSEILGQSSDSIRQRARRNMFDWPMLSGVLLDAFGQVYGNLPHKIAEQRKRSATSSRSPDDQLRDVPANQVLTSTQNMTVIKKDEIEGGGTILTIPGAEPIALVIPPASALSSAEAFRDWTLPFLHKIVVANKLNVQMKSGADSNGVNYLLFDSPPSEANRVRYIFYLPTGNDGSVFGIVIQKYNLTTGARLVP